MRRFAGGTGRCAQGTISLFYLRRGMFSRDETLRFEPKTF